MDEFITNTQINTGRTLCSPSSPLPANFLAPPVTVVARHRPTPAADADRHYQEGDGENESTQSDATEPEVGLEPGQSGSKDSARIDEACGRQHDAGKTSQRDAYAHRQDPAHLDPLQRLIPHDACQNTFANWRENVAPRIDGGMAVLSL
jgi:hypothetical protein